MSTIQDFFSSDMLWVILIAARAKPRPIVGQCNTDWRAGKVLNGNIVALTKCDLEVWD